MKQGVRKLGGADMTIREYIVNMTLKAAEERLEALKRIGAPAVIIDGQTKTVDDLKNGKLKISGDLEALDLEYKDREIKTGRGGKKYLVINGKVNYFPNAKYGMYIKFA